MLWYLNKTYRYSDFNNSKRERKIVILSTTLKIHSASDPSGIRDYGGDFGILGRNLLSWIIQISLVHSLKKYFNLKSSVIENFITEICYFNKLCGVRKVYVRFRYFLLITYRSKAR